MGFFCGIVGLNQSIRVYERNIYNIVSTFSDSYNDIKVSELAIFGFATKKNNPTILFSSPIIQQKDKKLFLADSRLDNRDQLISLLKITSQSSNADIILSAYEKWGKDCLQYLIGDFAFIISDLVKQEIFCARDRLGIKPFYYVLNDSYFAFSSDISTLFQLNTIEKQPDIDMMQSFLYYAQVTPDHTLFQEVRRLPAGHCLIIKNKKIEVLRYWNPEKIKINREISFQAASSQLKGLLETAVNTRLSSNGHVATELSGGLDSTSVTCLAAKNRKEFLKTIYSLRFGTYNCDEGVFINAVSDILKKKHISVNADNLDYKTKYNMNFVYEVQKDWPLMGASVHLFPLVETMNTNDTHIVLTGQGGDHILTGNLDILADYLKSFHWIKLYKALKYYHFSKAILKRNVILPFYRYLSDKQKRRIKKIFSFIRFYKPNKVHLVSKKRPPDNVLCNPKEKSFAFCRDVSYVTDNLYLTWIDTNMYQALERKYGIEFRHPFLDSRLVEFMLSLPAEYKLNKGITKKILRTAMQEIIPDIVRLRNDKAEYSEILLDQIRAIDLEELLSNPMIVQLGIISAEEITNMIKKYQEGELKQIVFFWRTINLEYWYKVNFFNQ